MHIQDIASALAKKFNIEGLESKDGRIEVAIDGADVLIEETDADMFIFTGAIGMAPSEGAETFANILLEGNMALMNAKDAALARDPESQEYVLIERVSANTASDFESFCECLGNFANTLEMWRKMLSDFSPAAKQAAADSAEKKDLSIEALRNGYLSV